MARLFLSTDADAPVFAQGRGALVNLLNKCLIEGYGDKRPVGGWTMPYVNAEGTVAAFRNNHEGGGLGMYLRVDGTRPGTASYATVQAYENMSDEESGTFPFPLNANNVYLGANASPQHWALAATDTWVFLAAYPGSSPVGNKAVQAAYGFWFGDIESIRPNDAYHCMFSILGSSGYEGFGSTAKEAGYSSDTKNGSGGSGTGAWNYSARYWFPRRSDGSGTARSYYAYLPYPAWGVVCGSGSMSLDPAGPLLYGRILLNEAAYTLRGWIPQMISPMQPLVYLDRVVVNGETWVAILITGGQVLVKLDAGE